MESLNNKTLYGIEKRASLYSSVVGIGFALLHQGKCTHAHTYYDLIAIIIKFNNILYISFA